MHSLTFASVVDGDLVVLQASVSLLSHFTRLSAGEHGKPTTHGSTYDPYGKTL